MKRFAYTLAFITSFCFLLSFANRSAAPDDITGAWRIEQGNLEQVIIYQDGYFSQTVFDKTNKIFTGTIGGIYKVKDNNIDTRLEFSSKNKADVGKENKYSFVITGDEMTVNDQGTSVTMKRIDTGKDNLAGIWRITGRMQNGEVVQMQRGDRKTLKLLSGTRFQWMAINPATKEFFGTGGGTYTFKDGKYTETIEFFSRDNSRVGASLVFDGSVKAEVWNHKGLSSKGDPINELWTKEKY